MLILFYMEYISGITYFVYIFISMKVHRMQSSSSDELDRVECELRSTRFDAGHKYEKR